MPGETAAKGKRKHAPREVPFFLAVGRWYRNANTCVAIPDWKCVTTKYGRPSWPRPDQGPSALRSPLVNVRVRVGPLRVWDTLFGCQT